MTRLAVFVATFGYVGLFPIAPGTAGSVAGLVVYAVLERAGASALSVAGVIAAVFVTGLWAATVAERHFGGIDPGPVVIDEVLGMLMTLFLVPVSVTAIVAGFLLFRVFDIVKPFPAGRLERLPGGVGVMCDDAMAGVYANVCLWILWWAVPAWMA